MIRLKELRNSMSNPKGRKISQQEIADIIEVKRSTVSMWELGASDPDTTSLQKLASYFNVSTDYLLGRETPETKKGLSATESKEVDEIYNIYDKLSDEAKKKLVEYADDLLGNPKNLK